MFYTEQYAGNLDKTQHTTLFVLSRELPQSTQNSIQDNPYTKAET